MNNIIKYNYEQTTRYLAEKNLISKGDIHYYDNDPNYDNEFEEVYQCYQKLLKKYEEIYDIKPAYLYFRSHYDLNAYADCSNQHFIMAINMTVIQEQIKAFNENIFIKETNIPLLISLQSKIDAPINILMWQLASHYTFYHELGHLVQKSDLIRTNLENQSTSKKFNKCKHIAELDADSFSTLYIATYIIDYAKNQFNGKILKEDLHSLISVACSSILLYRMLLPSFKRSIYYEEGTHPHPVPRIILMINNIVGYLIKGASKGDIPLINENEVIKNTMILSDKLYPSIVKDTISSIPSFLELIEKEKSNISKYLSNYVSLINEDPNLSVNKRNAILANQK